METLGQTARVRALHREDGRYKVRFRKVQDAYFEMTEQNLPFLL